MVENLRSDHFRPLIESAITLTTESGENIAVIVVEVIENPRGKPKRAPTSRRVPFSVLLAGPLQPSLLHGACSLAVPDCDAPVSLHVNRIAPVDGTNDRAWYEIAFC